MAESSSLKAPAPPVNRRRSSSVTSALKLLQQRGRNMRSAAPESYEPSVAATTCHISVCLFLHFPQRVHDSDCQANPAQWAVRQSREDRGQAAAKERPSSRPWILIDLGMTGPIKFNPFKYLLFPCNKQPNGKYTKGLGDLAFIAYYIVFWSFVRQFVTLYILRPMAKRLGIRPAKVPRFTELFYFGIMGVAGIASAAMQASLTADWNEPPPDLVVQDRVYYLMQAAYWCQQTIILALKIEKPRKDYKELVAHLAKCVNYWNDPASTPFFAFFVVVWTYMRHYLNIKILWGVYKYFDLIPVDQRTVWEPLKDNWMVWWMKWQIFAPIFLLQCINLFWYFLIWRILIRVIFFDIRKDERSDDEDEEESDPPKQVGDADKTQ
ncbi:ceramide synthase component, Lag1p [Trichosporon asahii var. asahii CBS 8904]|uniref:Ceramide synthase component, Lag1p n=1 Tax=Trichosporon asahii var. asahii (strain CBS 8904) TaxID=1220162 RepID=K1WNS4_TRIAC|nr:ceramide synthase component, Lag1p [Trichosporon asahii var. asahii CBS 8904]